MIGAGQHIWVRMWNDLVEGDDAVSADGVLYPGQDIALRFTEPQTVTHWSLVRITKEDAALLADEKGVKQEL